LPATPPIWLTPDGRLNPERLLEAFLAFWRCHGQPLLGTTAYHEIAPHLVLMAFLDRVANGGGRVERESAVGRGRLDAYWANYLKPWDIAAGALIAMESGAEICRQNGQAFNPWLGELLVCASVPLRKEIQDCFLEVETRRK
jgi:hypothetical protein